MHTCMYVHACAQAHTNIKLGQTNKPNIGKKQQYETT